MLDSPPLQEADFSSFSCKNLREMLYLSLVGSALTEPEKMRSCSSCAGLVKKEYFWRYAQ